MTAPQPTAAAEPDIDGLIERLRQPPPMHCVNALCEEAAEALKRLRDERDHYKRIHDLMAEDGAANLERAEAAEAENAALRAVVEAARFMQTHEGCRDAEPGDIGRLRAAFAALDRLKQRKREDKNV